MITGVELLIISVISVALGWMTASLFLERDYTDAYADGYQAALADARADANG